MSQNHIGTWEWEILPDRITWSNELFGIYGITPDEFNATFEGTLRYVHPDDRHIVKTTFERSHYTSEPFTLDHRIILADGTVRVLREEGIPRKDSSGNVFKIEGTAQDVSERTHVETELRRRDKIMRSLLDDLQTSKERLEKQALVLKQFAAIVESSDDAIISWAPDGSIISWNPAATRIYGYTADEVKNRSISLLTASDRPLELGEILEKIHLGERIEYFETRRKRKDGSQIDVSLTLSPIRSTKGRIESISDTARDITARKRSERQIQMLGHTITSMNEGVVITNMENTIIFINSAFTRTYGYTEDEILGMNIAVLRSMNNPSEVTRQISSETRKGGWQGELLNVRKNGEEFPILLSTSVIYDKQGAPVALVGISRDITDQKRMQRQLDAIERQRTEDLRMFATSVQQAQEEERRRIARELHDDLGQQLSALKFNIEVFEDVVPKSDRKIRNKLKHFKQQIDNMIVAIRRISSDLHPSALDDFGLVIALQLLSKDFEKLHHITTTFNSKDLQMERYDPLIEIALYRIAQEALSNVTKHAQATKVSLELMHRENLVILEIQDNGKGVDPGIVQQRKGSDRGLGLISMKERSQHLGGMFHFESVPNAGTKITVEVPLR